MPSVPLTRDEARRRALLVSDVSYAVELDLSGGGDTFSSRTVARFSCTEPGASTFVDLDAANVASVTLNGREVGAEALDGPRIRLEGLAARNELEVVAACSYQRTGVGLHRFSDPVDGETYVHTQFEPFDAHRVYACFDQPDLKAPFSLTVRAPAGWEVISNGPVEERPPHGEPGVWRFTETLPLSTYITAVCAGPFHAVHSTHGDIDLGVYCRRSLAEYLDADEILEVTRQGFDFFTEAFGYAYPFGQGAGPEGARRKYDQLFVPEFNWGAMENAACVTFSESYVFRSKVTEASREARASTILHEMAHMWFGNLVTMRWWDDLWLNESFATYMGHLALVEATRFRNAWAHFAYGTKAWALRQDQLPTTHPIVADMTDTDAVRTNFDGITYAKGASVLKQLVAWVGREPFLAGLRDYFRRHAHGNAELVDFLTALEKTSRRELADWSAQWLETAGVATLRPVSETDDGRYRSVALLQEAPAEHPSLRDHRLAIGCYRRRDGSLSRAGRVELDVTGPRTDVAELAGEPVPDLLLVNDDDLAFAKIRLDERSIQTLLADLGRLREPLPRALCWGAAWDMTRDAELAARRWVRLVAAHADGEGEIGLLQTLLAQARTAIDHYGDPENRHAARRELAASAREALAGAEPGSDFQLVWARTRASIDADRDWVRGLLDGEVSVPGLAVDTDLRWHLVGALVSAGVAGEEIIEAELERDPTDMGARRAAAARASRPDAEAKAQAWRALLGGDGDGRQLTLAETRAVVGGFHQPDQEELLAAYIDPYVDALPGIWRDRSPDEALLLTTGLYPSTIVDQRVVDAADRASDLPDLPPPARRLIIEARDGTLRALRARAADRAYASAATDDARSGQR